MDRSLKAMDRETCNPEELPSPPSICPTESGPLPHSACDKVGENVLCRRSLPPLNELIRYGLAWLQHFHRFSRP